MTRVILIHAGPTPWDDEDRLVGNHPLPLSDEAHVAIEEVVANLPKPVTAVYCARRNEACDQVAKMIASKFDIRVRDNEALDGLDLGLWQGLTRAELRFRFPSVIREWQESPLTVNPPDGETLGDAIERYRAAIKKILRRNRAGTIVIPLRPRPLQIVTGIMHGEEPLTIARHLHKVTAVETMELTDGQFQQLVA